MSTLALREPLDTLREGVAWPDRPMDSIVVCMSSSLCCASLTWPSRETDWDNYQVSVAPMKTSQPNGGCTSDKSDRSYH